MKRTPSGRFLKTVYQLAQAQYTKASEYRRQVMLAKAYAVIEQAKRS